MKRTIIAMIMLIVLALQCAYATDWTKLGEAASGTISPGDRVYTNYIVKTGSGPAGVLIGKVSTNVKYWFGLRNSNNDRVHKEAIPAIITDPHNYIYTFPNGGFSGSIAYKDGSGVKTKKYRLCVQVDSNSTTSGYMDIYMFVP